MISVFAASRLAFLKLVSHPSSKQWQTEFAKLNDPKGNGRAQASFAELSYVNKEHISLDSTYPTIRAKSVDDLLDGADGGDSPDSTRCINSSRTSSYMYIH